MTSAQSHLDYYRERQRDVVRAARHSRLAEAVEQSRRDERRGFLDRLHMRRLREAPAC